MPVELFILAGFLGSGKTTLLLDLLKSDSQGETGVIVNEAGEIGVDGVVVKDGADDIPLTLLSNGCVCCSLRSSLVLTVGAMLDAPRPPGARPLRRIVLETSGLSRPGPIVASLADPELARRGIRVTVVSTYDCVRGALNVDEFDEAAAQLGAAQRVMLTKLDLVAPEAARAHIEVIRGVNPLAQIVADTDRAAAVRQAFADSGPAGPAEGGAASLAESTVQGLFGGAPAKAHPRIHVMAGALRAGASWDDVAMWLDDLASICGDKLLRVKAVLKVADCAEPIHIQSVGATFGAPRRLVGLAAHEDICVVIARDIDAGDIQAALPDAPIALSNTKHSAVAQRSSKVFA